MGSIAPSAHSVQKPSRVKPVMAIPSVEHVTTVSPQSATPMTPLVGPSPSSGAAMPLARSHSRQVPRSVPVASSYEPE